MSNKDMEAGEARGDPLEAVLYAVFVATSARASVAELGQILQARLIHVQFTKPACLRHSVPAGKPSSATTLAGSGLA